MDCSVTSLISASPPSRKSAMIEEKCVIKYLLLNQVFSEYYHDSLSYSIFGMMSVITFLFVLPIVLSSIHHYGLFSHRLSSVCIRM